MTDRVDSAVKHCASEISERNGVVAQGHSSASHYECSEAPQTGNNCTSEHCRFCCENSYHFAESSPLNRSAYSEICPRVGDDAAGIAGADVDNSGPIIGCSPHPESHLEDV